MNENNEIKISEMNEAAIINDDDFFMIVQNGENKKASANLINPKNGYSVNLSNIIIANTNYTLPNNLKYKVGNNSLEVYYCGTKLIKSVDYNEVGTKNSISNKIQFLIQIGDLNMNNIPGFENFTETLEFIVRGEYIDN